MVEHKPTHVTTSHAPPPLHFIDNDELHNSDCVLVSPPQEILAKEEMGRIRILKKSVQQPRHARTSVHRECLSHAKYPQHTAVEALHLLLDLLHGDQLHPDQSDWQTSLPHLHLGQSKDSVHLYGAARCLLRSIYGLGES